MATIHAKSGTVFSDLELEKNVEQMVLEAGGVKVTDSIIPPSVIETVDQGTQLNLVDGWGDVFNNATQTYVIRHQGDTVWIHLCANSAGAGWVVVEERAFEATAKLLPAGELKKALDSTGKVSMQINFAVDKAEILPDSMPQIEQVANLLKTDLNLRLVINGHTDSTGEVSRNRSLSLARADSVRAALVARGIAADRLRTQGFGQDQPVASNADELGRAQNRRVELVKQ